MLFLQAVIFPGPFDVVTLGEMNLAIEARLDILDRPGEVAAANAELYRYVALPVFAIDGERAFTQRHIGDLSEGNTIAVRCGKEDVANCFRRAAIFRLIAEHKIEAAVAL